MDYWSQIGSAVWALLNSEVGLMLMGSLLLLVARKVYTAKPLIEQYEGTLIEAVKWAEKNVTGPGRGEQRLKAALQFVSRVFADYERRKPTKAEAEQIEERLIVTHADLEAKGNL